MWLIEGEWFPSKDHALTTFRYAVKAKDLLDALQKADVKLAGKDPLKLTVSHLGVWPDEVIQ
jgi:hypothetical protein